MKLVAHFILSSVLFFPSLHAQEVKAVAKPAEVEMDKAPKSLKKVSPEKAENKEKKAKGSKELEIVKKREYTDKEAIDIVSKAEKKRVGDNCELEVSLRTIGRKQDSTYEMDIIRGQDKKALVLFHEPPEEKGRKLLVIRDRYWAKFPDSRKIHPVSRREMLGNSLFGIVDLFQIDVHEEYKATIKGETKIGKHDVYFAQLDARHEKAVYKKIDYFISTKDNFPIRAKFYAESGRLLKTLVLTGRRKLAGEVRPDRFNMIDNVTRGRRSMWKTRTMKLVDVPDSVFRRSQLRKQ